MKHDHEQLRDSSEECGEMNKTGHIQSNSQQNDVTTIQPQLDTLLNAQTVLNKGEVALVE